MKEKYIINDQPLPIDKSEIDKHKDFDKVMRRYRIHRFVNGNRNPWRWIGYGSLLIFLISTFFMIPPSRYKKTTSPTQAPKRASEKPISVTKSPPMNDAVKINEDPKQVVQEGQKPPNIVSEQIVIKQIVQPLPASEEGVFFSNPKADSTKNTTSLPDALPREQKYAEAEPLIGFPALYQYLSEEVTYPPEALADSLEGGVKIRFVINSEGEVRKTEIIQSLSELHDQEALRVINQMPTWKPAQLNGQNVSSRMSIMLTFKIRR